MRCGQIGMPSRCVPPLLSSTPPYLQLHVLREPPFKRNLDLGVNFLVEHGEVLSHHLWRELRKGRAFSTVL